MSELQACRCGRQTKPKPCRHGFTRWVGYVSVIAGACAAWTVKLGLVLGLGTVAVFG